MFMPTFDVVSEVDLQEVHNAVDQANREIGTRFDFKGVDASFERLEDQVTMTAEADFQLGQMFDVLKSKLVNRKVDTRALEELDASASGKLVGQVILIRQGIDKALAKKIVKMVKDDKSKMQAQVQGEKVRITGKKRDDLQRMIAALRESDDIDIPLQFENFRD
jgi:uncharacterized protein YajQ (UPF0234 family)